MTVHQNAEVLFEELYETAARSTESMILNAPSQIVSILLKEDFEAFWF